MWVCGWVSRSMNSGFPVSQTSQSSRLSMYVYKTLIWDSCRHITPSSQRYSSPTMPPKIRTHTHTHTKQTVMHLRYTPTKQTACHAPEIHTPSRLEGRALLSHAKISFPMTLDNPPLLYTCIYFSTHPLMVHPTNNKHIPVTILGYIISLLNNTSTLEELHDSSKNRNAF